MQRTDKRNFLFATSITNTNVADTTRYLSHHIISTRCNYSTLHPSKDLDAVSGSASASGSSSASVMASTAALCVFDKVKEYSGGGYDVYDDDDDDGGGLDEYGVSVKGKVVCSLRSDRIVRMWT